MPLFSPDRRRALLPDRVLRPLGELLVQLEEVIEAIGAHVDPRWRDGAERIRGAIAALRAPTARELELRADIDVDEPARRAAEVARVAELEKDSDARWLAGLRAQSALEHARENIEKAVPRVIRAIRKGQAVVRDVKRRA